MPGSRQSPLSPVPAGVTMNERFTTRGTPGTTTMLFSKRLSLSNLIDLCRAVRHYLGAGLPITKVFKQQASKGPLPVRPVADRITLELGRGQSLKKALAREKDYFPPLLVSLASVGEATGMLPEVFTDLEKYYVRQLQLRRQFISQIFWPVVQLVMAVFVVAALIFILGMLPQNQNRTAYDPLGLGLTGATGALIFLSVVGCVVVVLGGGYLLLRRLLRERAGVDGFLLRLPALGPCLRTLALARFCLALRLTTETGMAITRAMRLSLEATGNNAFAAAVSDTETLLEAGQDLTGVLASCRLFPEDFLTVIAVAEESGRLSEVLRHQADHYDEEAGRRLAVLTNLASYGVWILVGALIIITIFRLFSSYLSQLQV
jgi:type IV pilus assembly protein PilC